MMLIFKHKILEKIVSLKLKKYTIKNFVSLKLIERKLIYVYDHKSSCVLVKGANEVDIRDFVKIFLMDLSINFQGKYSLQEVYSIEQLENLYKRMEITCRKTIYIMTSDIFCDQKTMEVFINSRMRDPYSSFLLWDCFFINEKNFDVDYELIEVERKKGRPKFGKKVFDFY